jgi:hypothetical protein
MGWESLGKKKKCPNYITDWLIAAAQPEAEFMNEQFL